MSKEKKKRLFEMFTAVFLTVLLLAGTFAVSAPGARAAGETGSITVNMKDNDGKAIEGGELSLYLVATGTESKGSLGYDYSYTEEFRNGEGFSDLEQKADLKDGKNLLNEDVVSAVDSFQKKNNIKALKTQKVASDGTCRFSDLEPGVYLIRQTSYDKEASGVIKPFLMTVPTQETDGSGRLDFEVNASPKVSWEGLGDPSVTKVIKGIKDENTSFEFKLKAENAQNPMPSGSSGGEKTILIYGNGTKEFGEIRFTSPGTYDYFVTETVENKVGYTYDRTRYRITYKVNDVEGAASGSALTVSRTITEVNENGAQTGSSRNGENAIFTNTYKEPTVKPGEAKPSALKKIKGKTPSSSSAFSFTLARTKITDPMPKGSSRGKKTVQIKGTGEVGFGTIKFKKAGTYTYTVREKAGKAAGYTYDDSVYRIVYKVKKDGSKLKVSQNVYRGEKKGKLAKKNSDMPVFTNTYSPQSVPPGTTTKKKNGKLPQTGQLWWPVFVLIGAGGALIAAGLVRRRSRQ